MLRTGRVPGVCSGRSVELEHGQAGAISAVGGRWNGHWCQADLGDDGFADKQGASKVVTTVHLPLTGVACVKRICRPVHTGLHPAGLQLIGTWCPACRLPRGLEQLVGLPIPPAIPLSRFPGTSSMSQSRATSATPSHPFGRTAAPSSVRALTTPAPSPSGADGLSGGPGRRDRCALLRQPGRH